MHVVLFGAGKIGSAAIARFVRNAGHSLTMLDVNPALVEELSRAGRYTVHSVGEGVDKHETVSGYEIYCLGTPEADRAIERADLAFTAVGVNHVGPLLEDVMPALIRRAKAGAERMDMIFCENKIGLTEIVRSAMRKAAGAEWETVAPTVNPVSGCVGIVVAPTPGALELEKGPYDIIHIDADEVSDGFDLPGFKPVRPFGFYIREKLFVYNMAHAIGAYMGMLKGYTYEWEAASDPEIGGVMHRAMDATCRALTMEYGVKDTAARAEDIFERINNRYFHDPCWRVGIDPIRKLGPDDRLTGAYLYAREHGIVCDAYFYGIAAGLLFSHPSDPAAAEVQACIRRDGVEAAIRKYTGLMRAEEVGRIRELYESFSNAQV